MKKIKRKKSRKLLYFLLGIVLFVICFVGCQADFVARQLLFHPTKYPKGNWEILDDAKYVSMEVNFRNEKDQLLVGRYFSYQKIVENDTARGSVLYCHGNAINISHMTDFALRLSRDLRCNVLIFDYAGYGKSSGEPTATGILGDGRAARDWLAAFDGIDRERVIVYGQSLGGSVAVDIAAIDGARGLIVESSFTSIGDMGRKLLPLLPANYLLRERLASIDKIGNVNCPVFISHGKADNVIPFTQGQRLFNAAKEPKTFFIPQLGNDYHSAPHSKEHRKKLKEFVETIP